MKEVGYGKQKQTEEGGRRERSDVIKKRETDKLEM
jgi:hypothetical protein